MAPWVYAFIHLGYRPLVLATVENKDPDESLLELEN